MPSLDSFRTQVVRNSLFAPCPLRQAIHRLGFVQADPIRSPARAQDLILRHRVKNYRAGDLERLYPKLGLEELYLFAYGFAPRKVWDTLHPRSTEPLSDVQQKIVALVNEYGPIHPKELEAHIGQERQRNYWGGHSRKAKMELETLHNRGALRVAGRNNGFRIYETAPPHSQSLSFRERYQELLLVALTAMGTTTRSFLMREMGHFSTLQKTRGLREDSLKELIDDGRIRVDTVDDVDYLTVNGLKQGRRSLNQVHLLAPFDPIVRDRERFEHLWGWRYRFEAYTPAAKRKLGYYAMPVLWRDQIVGWANAKIQEERLCVEFGYVNGRPKEADYVSAAEEELERFAQFMGLKPDAWKADPRLSA